MKKLLLIFVVACAGRADAPQPASTSVGGSSCQEGEISYYAASLDGQRTANGESYDQQALTAAHRTLPFGTELDVTVGEQSVHVRVNDRGPYAKHRILDVSGKAADILALRKVGHARARVCVSPQ